MAGWSSLCMVALLAGAIAGLAEDKASETVVGLVIILGMVLPSIIGTAMGMSALRKGASNPVAIGIALVWNALLLGGLILLMIIGNLSG